MGGINAYDQGSCFYFENATSAFVARTGRADPLPFTLNGWSRPTLGDLDGDGDLDLVVGGSDGSNTYDYAASSSVWKSDSRRWRLTTVSIMLRITHSQVVVPLLQKSEGRPQGGGHRVQRCRSNGRPEGRIKGIDGQDKRTAGVRQGPVHRRLQRRRTRRHGPAPEERQAPGDAQVTTQ